MGNLWTCVENLGDPFFDIYESRDEAIRSFSEHSTRFHVVPVLEYVPFVDASCIIDQAVADCSNEIWSEWFEDSTLPWPSDDSLDELGNLLTPIFLEWLKRHGYDKLFPKYYYDGNGEGEELIEVGKSE